MTKTIKEMTKEFIGGTVGLLAYYPRAPRTHRNVLTRAHYHRLSETEIEVSAVNGHNLSRIPYVKKVIISREEFDNRDFETCNDLVEWVWAMQLLGIETFFDQTDYEDCQ